MPESNAVVEKRPPATHSEGIAVRTPTKPLAWQVRRWGQRYAEASPVDHPAVRAWQKLGPGRGVPDELELLRDDKSTIYRLIGVGFEGATVIAKRCDSEAAKIEWLVYNEILPRSGMSALRCYASIVDDDPRFSWLFLEDAGDEKYSSDVEEHRILAGLWLGAMNISAQQLPLATCLPDQGPTSYFEKLQLARNMTSEKLAHPAFSTNDREILRAIAFHCDLLERHWGRIEQFCAGMPRTLVHGDLSSWNARIQANHTGKSLLIMDWESAGWGVTAVDLAQFAGHSLTPDIAAYWSVTQVCWPQLDLSVLRLLGELGRIFRWINAVVWANWGFQDYAGAIAWYIEEMSYYEPQMAEWAQGTKALLELE